jgi:hypothetical protein
MFPSTSNRHDYLNIYQRNQLWKRLRTTLVQQQTEQMDGAGKRLSKRAWPTDSREKQKNSWIILFRSRLFLIALRADKQANKVELAIQLDRACKEHALRSHE